MPYLCGGYVGGGRLTSHNGLGSSKLNTLKLVVLQDAAVPPIDLYEITS